MKFFIKKGTPCELTFYDSENKLWHAIDSVIECDWMLAKENFDALEWEEIVDDVSFGTKGEDVMICFEQTPHDFYILVPWEQIMKLM